jgi:hypothetical protein
VTKFMLGGGAVDCPKDLYNGRSEAGAGQVPSLRGSLMGEMPRQHLLEPIVPYSDTLESSGYIRR